MKRNINVIQINGVRGLVMAAFVVTCLAAGFIVFPGWVGMHCWNFLTAYVDKIPMIGLFQGILLWGIIVAAYFTFRKNKLVVCFRAPKGLEEDELKSVFADIKKQSAEDPILQAMLKAREMELNSKKEETMPDEKEEPETQLEVKK